jgi:DNA polymerase V
MNSNNAPTDLDLLLNARAASGFSEPIFDHMDGGLDLNQHIIKHPAATFFVRAKGEPMLDAGIFAGDLLIVDRSLTPKDGSIVIAVLNGELRVKRLKIISGKCFLQAENKLQQILVDSIEGFQFWGVVTHAIHDVCVSRL